MVIEYKDDRRPGECPYCGRDFESEAALDGHVPCPENRGDGDPRPRTFDR